MRCDCAADNMDDSPAPPVLVLDAPTYGRRPSGHALKRRRNTLPCDFIAYVFSGSGAAQAFGVIRLKDVSQASAGHLLDDDLADFFRAFFVHRPTSAAVWAIDRECTRALLEPFAMTVEVCRSWQQVAHLQKKQEASNLLMACGLVPNAWGIRLLRLPTAALAAAATSTLFAIVPPISYCLSAGAPGPASIATPLPPQQMPSELPLVGIAQNTSDSHKGGGCINYILEPMVLLRAWRVMQFMASQKTELTSIVDLAIDLCVDRFHAGAIRKAMQEGVWRLPSREVLRCVSFNINLMDLHFQRDVNRSVSAFRYLHADASKQGSFTYLVLEEDSIQFASACSPETILPQSLQL